MGKAQRTKGARFERLVANRLRLKYPNATIKRNRQSEGALDSDVSIAGSGSWADWLWIECQHARQPSPVRKMEQAQKDIEHIHESHRVPVVIWRKTGAKQVRVSFFLLDWMARTNHLSDCDILTHDWGSPLMVEVSLDDFVDFMLPEERSDTEDR